jgi:hypothetical protein
MQRFIRFSTLLILVFALGLNARAAPRVEMEVVMENGLQANAGAQKWMKILEDAGIPNVRFRGATPSDKVSARIEGTGDKAVVHVVAQLSAKGQLVTPGGPFNVGDGAKLKKWLADVADAAGPQGPRKTAFGLTAKQFDEVRQALAVPVAIETKGQRPEKVIQQLTSKLPLTLAIDPAIQKAIAADDPVRDELKGVATGTALAALARPAGAVLLPHAGAQGVSLELVKANAGGEMWPIGWPPEEKDESKIVPMLFQFIPVDIDGVPASQAIDALAERLKTPLVFDYNNMLRQKVDLNKPVKLPAGKTFYRKIVDLVLFQVGLKAEIRLDDAGKPLLWITTL